MAENTTPSTDPAARTGSSTPAKKQKTGRGAAATAGLVVGAVLTILLVIFIVQNGEDVTPEFLTFTLPTLALGVYLLLAAAVGIVIALLVTGTRKITKKL
ncbi:hypothetical protein GCM10027047_12490 [Rhodococcus aerolatus]